MTLKILTKKGMKENSRNVKKGKKMKQRGKSWPRKGEKE